VKTFSTRPAAFRVALAAAVALIVSSAAGSCFAVDLQKEAISLCERYRLNFSAIKTLKLEYHIDIAVTGGAPQPGLSPRHTAVWDKGKGRLKRVDAGAGRRISLADAGTRIIEYNDGGAGGSATVLRDEMDEAAVVAMTNPYPGWLWRPEWVLPAAPADVREDGGALVVRSGSGAAAREIWLNRSSALLEKFSDTDWNGKVVRIVTPGNWTDRGGVWVPRVIEEETRTRAGVIRRTVYLDTVTVNGPAGDADFTIP